MANKIGAHEKSLDAMHQRLRDHDMQLASLNVQNAHCLERLTRIEATTSNDHRLLVHLEGSVEGLKSQVSELSAITHSTHDLLQTHISDGTALLERQAVENARLMERQARQSIGLMEAQSRRHIRLTTYFGAILVLLVMIHQALTGESILTLIGGLFG